MDSLNNVALESFGIGILTLMIGHVMFHFGVNKKETKRNNHNLSLILFMIGFVLHFIMEFGGLNKWYCDKH